MQASKSKEGQIIEVPKDSHHYSAKKIDFKTKREELNYLSGTPDLGLFDGILVAAHYGLENFQLGQRKGLNLKGKKEPAYVIKIDEAENRLFVGLGADHPGLFREAFFFPNEKTEWTNDLKLNENESVPVEVLRNEILKNAELYRYEDGIFLKFDKPEKIFTNNEEITILKDKSTIAKIIY